MGIKTVGSKIQSAGAKVSVKEALSILSEAKKSGVTAGERAVLKDLFENGKLSPTARKTVGDFLEASAKPADVQLGTLLYPGKKLGGKTFTLKPLQSLVFEASGNQITNMGALTGKGVNLKQEFLRFDGLFGANSHYRYTVTVPADAKPGKVNTLKSSPACQSRHSPIYAFSFKVKVG